MLEIVGRIFDPLGISYYPEMARYLDTLIKEEPIGYRNQPGLNGKYFGKSVRINTQGLREEELHLKSKPGNLRILFLGDSVPFGIGVARKDTLPTQLERIANRTIHHGKTIEVINMGVPSYNTEQELIQMKTMGMDFKPDIVLLLFSRNDIESKMWVFEKRAGRIKDVVQRSYACSLLYLAFREFRARFPSVIKSSHASSGINHEIETAFVGFKANFQKWEKVRSSLAEINALAQRKDVPFVVILNQENSSLVKILRNEAKGQNFHLVNLEPSKDPRWLGSDMKKYVNSFTDGHPNADGNLILATLIYEKLVEIQIF
jgi:lysophospholipase L1-like esterase